MQYFSGDGNTKNRKLFIRKKNQNGKNRKRWRVNERLIVSEENSLRP